MTLSSAAVDVFPFPLLSLGTDSLDIQQTTVVQTVGVRCGSVICGTMRCGQGGTYSVVSSDPFLDAALADVL